MTDIELPNPHSRLEHYLGIIAGQEGAVLPKGIQSRLELYLLYIIEHGGGHGGVSIQVDSDTSIDDWDVPEMTVENVTEAHTTLAEGGSVSILNAAGDVTFTAFLGDISTGRPCITIEYYWLGFVDYQVTTNNTVAITVHKFEYDGPTPIGRYLTIWDCTTGLPVTNPVTIPYNYVTGDWYIIGNVGAVNYMPDGTVYDGTASRVVDPGLPQTLDMYRFDGTSWSWLDFGQQFRQILNGYYTKTESDNRYALITALNNYYNKTEADAKFAKKEDVIEPQTVVCYDQNGVAHTYEVNMQEVNI